ncbi:MAG: hypothetical protein Q8L16_23125 [Hydrogenophaga sp.]|nr:hypothetical protein [Hydrogenophaga sp.]
MKKYDTEETHILDQAKTYFGTHRFFKWPAFFLFITIGALILSKEIGEAIEYLSNKLKITHPENSAIENIAKEKEPRPVATISAQDPKKKSAQPTPSAPPKEFKSAAPSKVQNSSPSTQLPKVKPQEQQPSVTASTIPTEAMNGVVPKTESLVLPASSYSKLPGDAPSQLSPSNATSLNPSSTPGSGAAEQDKSFDRDTEFKSILAGLRRASPSGRSDALREVKSFLPEGLSGNEIAQLLGETTISYRLDCLTQIKDKIKPNSLPGTSIAAILKNESISYRVDLIRALAPYIATSISPENALSILGSLSISYRSDAIKLIAKKIRKPIPEIELQEILKNTYDSDLPIILPMLLSR